MIATGAEQVIVCISRRDRTLQLYLGAVFLRICIVSVDKGNCIVSEEGLRVVGRDGSEMGFGLIKLGRDIRWTRGKAKLDGFVEFLR